jgi:L-ascorbate oxidase
MEYPSPARRPSTLCALIAVCALLPAADTFAQSAAQTTVADPPKLELVRKAPRVGTLETGAPSISDEARLDLNVVYTTGKLWNPATQVFDNVELRSYQGTRVDPEVPFISPTLDIFPGDTIRIALHNKLPTDTSCTDPSAPVNTPHCFNGTNLHSHGLWVNPAGNSDNVLISINPGVDFEYEYNVPSDHPAGTFWYHTHRHGSTAMQVASGMAGALIIRGTRPPTPKENGDIDVLLRATTRQSFQERIIVAQQIQYACRENGKTGPIKTNPDGTYRCDPTDVGGVEAYDQLANGTWPKSGRYTSLNGRILPTFQGAKAGQIERWRVIHGGIRDTINLEFRKRVPNAKSAQGLKSSEQEAYIDESCTGEALPQHQIAADGLTLAAALKMASTIYQPAYRWDTLMVFPSAGTYCVIDTNAPVGATVDQAPPSRQLLGTVEVAAGQDVPVADIGAYLTNELVAAAAVNIPTTVRNEIVADLKDGLKLSRFIQHQDLSSYPNPGKQDLFFNISGGKFTVDDNEYLPSRIDRTLVLGTVDEWTLTSLVGSHPFHIHVNPFQVVKILDPNGKDVSGADAVDDFGGSVDPQYRGLKGSWRDTLWVKNSGGKTYTVVVRTKYQRYIGDFVLHCHILEHEDKGMMQNIRIALPNGAGGVSHGHH